MTDRVERDLLELEVRELTDLLRYDDGLAGLRKALAERGLMPSETVLAGLVEDEDENAYGVVLTASGGCIVFEADRNDVVTRWEAVDDIGSLEGDFQAVTVGATMRRLGQIT